MTNSATRIEALLRKRGPLSSQDLAEAIVANSICPNLAAARKAMERARRSELILSTLPVRFDRAFLYYLRNHKGKRYAAGVRKLLKTKPSYNRVFKTLLANKGWITSGQIGKAAGCLPDGDSRRPGGRKSLDLVIGELRKLEVIDSVAGMPQLFRIGTQFGSPSLTKSAFVYRITVEQDLLVRALDWLRNTYLLSYKKHSLRTNAKSAAGFNQALWDVHGPIYLGPSSREQTLRRTTSKENFLVADIVAYRTFGIVDAQALIKRSTDVVRRWKSISLTPVAISRSFSMDAWRLLRQSGIAAVLLSDIFGKNVDVLLQALWRALSDTDTSDHQITNIEETLAIAAGTVDDLGLVGNLKGTMFELLIALAWKSNGYDIVLQKVIRNSRDEEFEIDVVAIRGSECKLVECKGHHAAYREGEDELIRHFEKRCEAAADVYGWDITGRHDHIEALFCTSGQLDDDATTYADKTKKSHGIKCRVQTREDLMEWLGSLSQPHFHKIIKTYYTDKPLAPSTEYEPVPF